MLINKQINKQTKKYVATFALNEYLLSLIVPLSPLSRKKLEKKNGKLNEI